MISRPNDKFTKFFWNPKKSSLSRYLAVMGAYKRLPGTVYKNHETYVYYNSLGGGNYKQPQLPTTSFADADLDTKLYSLSRQLLTHWGRVTHLCVSKLTSIASDNGLSPGRRQAIIWNNAGILLIGPLGTNFSVFFYRNSNIFIEENTFENVVCKMSAILSRPQCVKHRFLVLGVCIHRNSMYACIEHCHFNNIS